MAQRKERELATAELGFKKQLTKEEKIEKKKQRLAAIGIDFFNHSFMQYPCNVSLCAFCIRDNFIYPPQNLVIVSFLPNKTPCLKICIRIYKELFRGMYMFSQY